MRVLMLHQHLFPKIHNGVIEFFKQITPKFKQRQIEIVFLTAPESKNFQEVQYHGRVNASKFSQ